MLPVGMRTRRSVSDDVNRMVTAVICAGALKLMLLDGFFDQGPSGTLLPIRSV